MRQCIKSLDQFGLNGSDNILCMYKFYTNPEPSQSHQNMDKGNQLIHSWSHNQEGDSSTWPIFALSYYVQPSPPLQVKKSSMKELIEKYITELSYKINGEEKARHMVEDKPKDEVEEYVIALKDMRDISSLIWREVLAIDELIFNRYKRELIIRSDIGLVTFEVLSTRDPLYDGGCYELKFEGKL